MFDISHPIIPVSIDLNGVTVSSMDIHPKQKKLYFVANDKKIYEYNFISKVIVSKEMPMENLTKIKLSPNGNYAVISDDTQKIALFDISKFPEVKLIGSHKGHRHTITAVACSEEPLAYFGGDELGKISKFYFKIDSKVGILPSWTSKNGRVNDIKYDETKNALIIATNLGIWIHDISRAHTESCATKDDIPLTITCSPQLSQTFAVGFQSGNFNVYEKTDFTLRSTRNFTGPIVSACYDQSCEYVAIGVKDEAIYCIQQDPEKVMQFGTSQQSTCPIAFAQLDETLPTRNGVDVASIAASIQKKAEETGKMVFTEERTTTTTTVTKTKPFPDFRPDEIETKVISQEPTKTETKRFITRRKQIVEKNVDTNINMEKLEEKSETTQIQEPQISETSITVDDLTKQKAQEKKIQDIAQTPPRIPSSPKFNIQEPDFTNNKPEEKPEKKSDKNQKNPESEVYSFVSDSGSDDQNSKPEVAELKNFMRGCFENMSQQMNTIYMDLLCKLKNLDDRVSKIEKSLGTKK
ncbi:hypothetical protein TVAG_172050 [Trichomonas vaginalis G3]|uniref:Uncharacterized protein n=2 Tax=Trichomonas vaginalis (strain ATCC PRA-98 / G3) TaxID=412133 RepID=A2DEV6_TRIV3|nr:hypothetical protein TVAG_172050 [Trichomonas vaginalis G3]|eukprot:XP_001581934.1 hypothetical protein [Trichomonas vaginalis G3]